jgi:prophage regulatory protein
MTRNFDPHDVILRKPQVVARTGLSKTTIYLRVKNGLFTKPVPLGLRAVGWPSGEVATLNAARIRGAQQQAVAGQARPPHRAVMH